MIVCYMVFVILLGREETKSHHLRCSWSSVSTSNSQLIFLSACLVKYVLSWAYSRPKLQYRSSFSLVASHFSIPSPLISYLPIPTHHYHLTLNLTSTNNTLPGSLPNASNPRLRTLPLHPTRLGKPQHIQNLTPRILAPSRTWRTAYGQRILLWFLIRLAQPIPMAEFLHRESVKSRSESAERCCTSLSFLSLPFFFFLPSRFSFS